MSGTEKCEGDRRGQKGTADSRQLKIWFGVQKRGLDRDVGF